MRLVSAQVRMDETICSEAGVGLWNTESNIDRATKVDQGIRVDAGRCFHGDVFRLANALR